MHLSLCVCVCLLLAWVDTHTHTPSLSLEEEERHQGITALAATGQCAADRLLVPSTSSAATALSLVGRTGELACPFNAVSQSQS